MLFAMIPLSALQGRSLPPGTILEADPGIDYSDWFPASEAGYSPFKNRQPDDYGASFPGGITPETLEY